MVCVKVPPRCGRHFAAPALCRAPRFSYHYPALGPGLRISRAPAKEKKRGPGE